jgi:hypothetical protein
METISLFFKVLWSPGEAMFLLSKTPRVLAPLLFLIVFGVVTQNLLLTKLDTAEIAIKAAEQQANARGTPLPDDQKQRIRDFMHSTLYKVLTQVAAIAGSLVLITLTCVLYFALFTMLGREGSFKAFFSITAFAFIPIILSQLTALISVFVVPQSAIMPDELGSLSPAVFLDRSAMPPALFAAVNSIDVVSIWILTLLIIGYRFTVRKSLSTVTRAVAVVSLFLVYVALKSVYHGFLGV